MCQNEELAISCLHVRRIALSSTRVRPQTSNHFLSVEFFALS